MGPGSLGTQGQGSPLNSDAVPSNAQQDPAPGRLNVPQRSSTYGGPQDLERNRQYRDRDGMPHARSEDLNHTGAYFALS
jgi:hypothetical protein